MNDFELILNLFENHLNTITIILSIVGVIFIILGLISYSQIMKHIKQSIESKIAEKIEGSDIKNKIEEELNKKIENYNISIVDVVRVEEQEKKLW